MTPTRTAFRELFILSKSIMDTYEYLPDAKTKYPFCFIEKGRNYEETNSDLHGTVQVNIHWFGTRSDGPKIDKAIVKFHDKLIQFNPQFEYNYQLTRWREIPQPMSPDAPNIEHYLAEIELLYTRKER